MPSRHRSQSFGWSQTNSPLGKPNRRDRLAQVRLHIRSYPKTSFHEKAVKLFLKFISHFSRWGCGSCFHPDSVYVGPCFDP